METIKHVGRDGAIGLGLLLLMIVAVMLAELAATGLIFLGELVLGAW